LTPQAAWWPLLRGRRSLPRGAVACADLAAHDLEMIARLGEIFLA
jgi:hypothetical protein